MYAQANRTVHVCTFCATGDDLRPCVEPPPVTKATLAAKSNSSKEAKRIWRGGAAAWHAERLGLRRSWFGFGSAATSAA